MQTGTIALHFLLHAKANNIVCQYNAEVVFVICNVDADVFAALSYLIQ